MRITSMDINNKEFKRTMRGYSADEVDEYLEKIAEDYEAIYKENTTLKEKISVFQDKLDHYTKIESTIQSTLLLAQNAAEQAKLSAQTEAELIVRNANDSAKRIMDKAHGDVLTVTDEFERTKQEFAKFRSKFRNFMLSQMEMFEALEKDFDKNYNISTVIEENNNNEVLSANLSNKKIKEIEKFDYNTSEFEEIKSFFAAEQN
ncbi:DivIVA domain-containing protein [Clostridium sp. UBA4548]|uniref:DivIVA domain-containing protein n=1 Tax=Clostridium sp. UBA4548 TaxID=1946361 RepID=UPI0025BDE3A7|nr:DivIVA domain-containing protein [Clostridium sp. UBA4548]